MSMKNFAADILMAIALILMVSAASTISVPMYPLLYVKLAHSFPEINNLQLMGAVLGVLAIIIGVAGAIISAETAMSKTNR